MIVTEVTGHELVVHLFAPLAGPGATAATGHLLDVWHRCQRELGMDRDVPRLGLPAAVPGGPASLTAEGPRYAALAACTRPGPGVFQAVLRRHHDVANLAVVLAPPSEEGVSWAIIDDMWSRAVGELPAELLGAARLYTGRLADHACEEVAVGPETVRAFASSLPVGAVSEGWESRDAAAVSGFGFGVWETGARQDDRLERRVVVVGTADADARLSAWTWSRGTTEITPFARYLLHAAKVRYQLRVWGHGRAVRDLQRDVDATTTVLGRMLDEGLRTAGRPAKHELGAVPEQLPLLRAGTAHLVRTSTAVAEMRRSVEIAGWNMHEAVAGGSDAAALGGLFRDDARLVDWFVHQLADDQTFLEASLTRALRVGEIVKERATDGPATVADRPVDDEVPLAGDDRERLLRELAAVFGDDVAAASVLDLVGLDRRFRLRFAGSTPQDVWRTLLAGMENGRVDAPYRRLIEAAVDEFPFNQTFLGLATRYGVTAGSDRR